MAFVAAVPAWVSLAAVGVSAAAGVYSAYQTAQTGAQQAADLKAQARTEATAAAQKQIERRRDLLRALASQNAAAGAAGIETGGSFGGIIRRQINENSNDLLVMNAGLQTRQRTLASQASNARQSANAQAATSLLDTAGSTLKNWPVN